ncbi:MAG: hypothetical protein AUG74_07805 [Bacteroidetes bacterium 13_1_20CM_4_60_6]|nr:MAG: hypothetical protein AUG74_07805 [Bacteroidetes bacterium 13_1_20CM_4_60_6]
MNNEQWIPADEICMNYNVEYSFISSLQQSGLIEITTDQDKRLISADKLDELEKFFRFHYDLDINIEGIEAIAHLLERIKELQKEIIKLKNFNTY